MNRNHGIPLALAVFGTSLVTALGKTILENEELISLLALVAGMAVVAMALAWGYIEWWKRGEFSPTVLQRINKPYRGKGIDPDARERNVVYNRAVRAGIIANLLAGVVFLLMDDVSVKEWIVLGVGWLVWSFVIGFSVPWAWRIVFYHMRPSRKRTEEEVEKDL